MQTADSICDLSKDGFQTDTGTIQEELKSKQITVIGGVMTCVLVTWFGHVIWKVTWRHDLWEIFHPAWFKNDFLLL